MKLIAMCMVINTHKQHFGDYYSTENIKEYEDQVLGIKQTKLKLVIKITSAWTGKNSVQFQACWEKFSNK